MFKLIDPIIKEDTEVKDDLEEYRKHLFPKVYPKPGMYKALCGVMAYASGSSIPKKGKRPTTEECLRVGTTCMECVKIRAGKV